MKARQTPACPVVFQQKTLSLCCFLLTGLFVTAQEPFPRGTRVTVDSEHLARFGPWLNPDAWKTQTSGERAGLVLAYHRGESLLWKQFIFGSDKLLSGAVALNGDRVVVAGSFTGELHLGDVILVAGDSFDAFYAIYDREGDLMEVGHVTSYLDVLGLDLEPGLFGLEMIGEFAGACLRLPLILPNSGETAFSEYVMDLNGDRSYVLSIERIRPVSRKPHLLHTSDGTLIRVGDVPPLPPDKPNPPPR